MKITRLRSNHSFKLLSRGLVVALASCAATIRAADVYKANNTDNLNLSSSWTNGAPPTSADVAVWDNTVAAANTVLLGADTNWSGIRIQDPAGAVQISAGNTLTLGAAGVDTSLASQPLTLACPVVVGASQNWNLVTAVTVSGVVSGTAGNGITNIGSGQINISGANNAFVDGITVNAGVVNVTAGSTMPVRLNGGQFLVGAAINNPVDVSPLGGTIRLTANRTLSGLFTGSGQATVLITSSSTTLSLGVNSFTNFNGTISLGTSAGGLRPNSTTFTGGTNTTFDLGSNNGYIVRNSSAAVVQLGALTGAAGTQLRGGGVIYQLGGKGIDDVFSGEIQNCSIVKVGPAVLTLDGVNTVNTYAGSTTISNGVLQIGNGGATGHLGTGPVTNYSQLVLNLGSGTLTLPNVITGSGSVTNSGFGKVRLTGANTYTGPTIITAGQLAIGTASQVASDYTVGDGAALGAVVTSGGATLTEGNVAFGSGCSYEFDLGAFGNPANIMVTNTGAISLAGNVTVNVSGTNFATGTITLLRYASRSGAGSFVLGSLPANVVATLNDDTLNKRVTLNITSVAGVVDMTFRWVGDLIGSWDIDNPANQIWKVVGTGQVTNYTEGVDVLFDDTATGTTNIDVTTFVNPSSVTVNNTNLAYTLGGAGSITGGGGLTKRGSGTLVVTNANSYSGMTAIENGKVVVAGDSGTLGSGGVTNNGQLVIDKTSATNVQPNTLLFSGQVTGTGSLTYLGVDKTNSILEMEIGSATGNPYSGGTLISNGFVRLNPNPSSDATRSAAKSTGLGTGMITLVGNSTLQLSDFGVGNASAQSGNFAAPLNVPASQTGELRTGGRMAISSPLTGLGTFNLVVSYIRCDVSGDFSAFGGQLNVNASPNATGNDFRVFNTLGFPLARVHLGIGTVGVTMYSQAANNSVIPVGELTGDAGSTLGFGNNVTWRIGGLGSAAAFAGNISSPNVSLIKEGAGTWTLIGTNTDYSGTTTISNGVLALVTNAVTDVGISNSTTISIAAPGILDVSGRVDGTFPLGTGTNSQTLRGTGTIRGRLAVGALGTLSPGFSIGTLTVTNAVTLGGSAVFELDRGASPNSDRLVAPAIAAGGTLTVTNIGAGLHAGDSFQLFSTPVSGAFATLDLQTNDAVNQLNYTWTNKLAINGTIAVLTASGPVNTTPTNLTFQAAGGQLTLTWPEDHTGWRLQAQTNSRSVGLSTNWVDVPGATATNRFDISIAPTNGAVFFRLLYP